MIPSVIEATREAAAKKLGVVQVDDNRFIVESGTKGRLVTLDETASALPCGCPDQIYRHKTACKHTIAALRFQAQQFSALRA